MYTIVTEWRVTGDPTQIFEDGGEWRFPHYSYVWKSSNMYNKRGRLDGELVITAEQAARSFVERAKEKREDVLPWKDGPHLHMRTVVYTDWDEVTDGQTETPPDRSSG